MPTLALNTAGLSLDDTERAVRLAQRVGILHIDFHPGTERDGVARVIAANKASGNAEIAPLFLTTKIRAVQDASVTPREAALLARRQIDEDLRVLGVGCVDLLMLRDGPDCGVVAAQWRVLEEAKASGKAKALGTVNFCEASLRCLLGSDDKPASAATNPAGTPAVTVKPAVNYYMLHPGMGTGVDKQAHGLRAFCEGRGIKTMAYGCLGEPAPSPELLAPGALLATIGVKHGRSAEAVALRWALQSGVAVSVRPTAQFSLRAGSVCRESGDSDLRDLSGSSCAAGLERRFDAAAGGWELTAREMGEIEALPSPDGEPCLFSRACNPVLGSGKPGDPLLG